jgi:hypothetical protein
MTDTIIQQIEQFACPRGTLDVYDLQILEAATSPSIWWLAEAGSLKNHHATRSRRTVKIPRMLSTLMRLLLIL